MPQYNVRHSSPLRSLENSVKNDSAKIREKLANRRSILNQSDGRIRSASGEYFPNVPRTKSFDTSYTVESADLPPHLMNHLQGLREGSFRSISRKRERKEAAEIKLKGLFSKSLTPSKSDDSMFPTVNSISVSSDSYDSPVKNNSPVSTASTKILDKNEDSSFGRASSFDDNDEEDKPHEITVSAQRWRFEEGHK